MEAAYAEEQLPEGWMKCVSKSAKGKVYYFNTLTGESIWEHPDAILFEDDQNEKKDTATPQSSIQANSKKEEYSSSNPQSRKRNHSEQKLKPLSKLITKPANRIKKGKNSSQIQTNISNRTAVKLKDAVEYLVGKNYSNSVEKSVTEGTKTIRNRWKSSGSDMGRFTEFSKRDNITKATSEKNTGGKQNIALTRKEISTTYEPGKDSKEKANSKSSRNSEKKSLQPLRPLKKNRPRNVDKSVMDGKTSMLNSHYKIPKTNTRPTEKASLKQLSGSISSDRVPVAMVSPAESHSGRFTPEDSLMAVRKDSSRSVRSVDSFSEKSSASWSAFDIAMTGTMEAESVSEYQGEQDVKSGDEDMDVDDAEYMAKKIFRQIESIRMDRIEVPRTFADKAADVAGKPINAQDGSLFIVLDTNILLSHLKFVSELKDSPIPGAGRPTIIIPWMVVQELDRLKTAPDSRIVELGEGENQPFVGVNVLARNAVSFIHNCLTQNHPRIRGQTVAEARQSIDGFIEETNDDSILCCCLLLKQQACDAKTVLLSNDRNLCSKAIVNGVKAFTKKELAVKGDIHHNTSSFMSWIAHISRFVDEMTLLSGLRDLFQSGNMIVHRDHFKEYFKEAEIQECLAKRQNKADDLVCELQCILREALAAIVEQEMTEAYDSLWLTVVKIKPPWTMIDTLELLEKHWIAVFGQIVNRSLQEKVKELRKKFLGGDANVRDLDRALELIDLSFTICDAFSKHSSYDGALPKCLAAIIVLKRTYQEFAGNLQPLGKLGSQQGELAKHRALPMENDNVNDLSKCITTVLHEDNEDMTVRQLQTKRPPHFAVMTTFDGIWQAVRRLSSSIFDSLDYPNPYPTNSDNENLRPSKEESRRFLQQLIPCLGRLVLGIQGVLGCSLDQSMENPVLFVELGQSIAEFLKTIMCQECKITFDELRAFCIDHLCSNAVAKLVAGRFRRLTCYLCDKAMKNALVQGLSQLDRALAMLQHCESFGNK